MTAYCTVADVRGVLAPDADDPSGTAAVLSDDQITAVIDDAQTEVDARLGVRYEVPFADPVPQPVKQITRDVAAYLATLTYRKTLDLSDQDPVVLRYTRAMNLLTAISKGQADLEVPTGDPEPETVGGMHGVNRYEGRMFTPGQFGLGVR